MHTVTAPKLDAASQASGSAVRVDRLVSDHGRIARVFPRVTKATPSDALAYSAEPDFWADADIVHISVTFTWDIERANRLADEWIKVADVKIGGQAMGMAGEDFEPGMYLKPGYVITSSGCPNRCWFCNVWRREGNVRELTIRDGWNVLDDNLLACSETHIRAVAAMLKRQNRRPEFTGGLEAKRLLTWHVDVLTDLRPTQMFFAYDTPDDLEPLNAAGALLKSAGFNRHHMRCYVLCGWPSDSMQAAEKRMLETVAAGFFPMAMLYRDAKGHTNANWRRFQRQWARPACIARVIANNVK